MQNITDVLAKTGKATAREIAAILKVDARDALDILRDLADSGQVENANGYWHLPGTGQQRHSAPPASAAPAGGTPSATAAVKARDLVSIIKKQGPLSADELAKLAGVTARKIASTLAMSTSKGELVRRQVNGKFRYALPGDTMNAPVATPVPESGCAGPAAAESLPDSPVSEPVAAEIGPVTANKKPDAATDYPAEPLQVYWNRPEDVQVFPTTKWARQRRKELRNELRWLDSIERIARKIERSKAVAAYLRDVL